MMSRSSIIGPCVVIAGHLAWLALGGCASVFAGGANESRLDSDGPPLDKTNGGHEVIPSEGERPLNPGPFEMQLRFLGFGRSGYKGDHHLRLEVVLTNHGAPIVINELGHSELDSYSSLTIKWYDAKSEKLIDPTAGKITMEIFGKALYHNPVTLDHGGKYVYVTSERISGRGTYVVAPGEYLVEAVYRDEDSSFVDRERGSKGSPPDERLDKIMSKGICSNRVKVTIPKIIKESESVLIDLVDIRVRVLGLNGNEGMGKSLRMAIDIVNNTQVTMARRIALEKDGKESHRVLKVCWYDVKSGVLVRAGDVFTSASFKTPGAGEPTKRGISDEVILLPGEKYTFETSGGFGNSGFGLTGMLPGEYDVEIVAREYVAVCKDIPLPGSRPVGKFFLWRSNKVRVTIPETTAQTPGNEKRSPESGQGDARKKAAGDK